MDTITIPLYLIEIAYCKNISNIIIIIILWVVNLFMLYGKVNRYLPKTAWEILKINLIRLAIPNQE